MYHCFRLHRGEDLYESIQRYADAHHIAAGVVLSAVGCVYRWELRDASGVDVQSGTEDVEIVSLMGTVSEHGSHLHASLAHRVRRTSAPRLPCEHHGGDRPRRAAGHRLYPRARRGDRLRGAGDPEN